MRCREEDAREEDASASAAGRDSSSRAPAWEPGTRAASPKVDGLDESFAASEAPRNEMLMRDCVLLPSSAMEEPSTLNAASRVTPDAALEGENAHAAASAADPANLTSEDGPGRS
jgi:hypothetical protein